MGKRLSQDATIIFNNTSYCPLELNTSMDSAFKFRAKYVVNFHESPHAHQSGIAHCLQETSLEPFLFVSFVPCLWMVSASKIPLQLPTRTTANVPRSYKELPKSDSVRVHSSTQTIPLRCSEVPPWHLYGYPEVTLPMLTLQSCSEHQISSAS